MKHLIPGLLALAALSAPPGQTTFTGIITDDMCAMVGHSQMRMGPTDAECVVACIRAHDAAYVLSDGKDRLRAHRPADPEKFAARKVRVTGTLDAKTKTIQVDSIVAAD